MADHARDGPARDRLSRPTPHRVGRLSFELDGPDEAALLRLRGEIVGGADSWIPAALDDALTSFDKAGRTLRIERLEVDLGDLPKGSLSAAQLTTALRSALAQHLRTVPDDTRVLPVLEPVQATLVATFCHFLATGRLPWWTVVDSIAEMEFSIAGLDSERLRDLARRGADILATIGGARRLVLQFTAEIAVSILLALPTAKPADFSTSDWPKPAEKEALEKLVARIRRIARASLGGTEDDEDSEAQPSAAKEAHVGPRTARELRATPHRREAEGLDDGLDVAVADAGLVLLHPFLATLFEARGLVSAGRFAGESEHLRAVQLTAWLAAGSVPAEEPQLIMAKLLCGWPLEESVPREALVTDDDLAEAEALLQAAVDHWSALGKASAAALRETFLQRPGTLRDDGKAWSLRVERRGADVLLERLPWGLGVVRLASMPRPLLVEWA
jgi:hypothetical protein